MHAEISPREQLKFDITRIEKPGKKALAIYSLQPSKIKYVN